MEKIIISALYNNDVINNQGVFPWNFPKYRNSFIDIMKTGNYIITDKSTENRRRNLLDDCGVEPIAIDPSEIEKTIRNITGERLFIFGGRGLYEASSQFVDKLMLARICCGGREGEVELNTDKPEYSRMRENLSKKEFEKRLKEDLEKKKGKNLGENIGLRFPINYQNKNLWKLVEASRFSFSDHRYFDIYKKIA